MAIKEEVSAATRAVLAPVSGPRMQPRLGGGVATPTAAPALARA